MDTDFTQEEFDHQRKQAELISSNFHTFFTNKLQTESFYAGGQTGIVRGVHLYLKLSSLDPDIVSNKLTHAARSLRDKIIEKKKKVLAEMETMAAGNLVSALTSWIPFVNVIVSLADMGLNIGLHIDIANREDAIQKLMESYSNVSKWTADIPEIEGLTFFSDMVRMHQEVDKEGFPTVNAAFADYIIHYIQAKQLTGMAASASEATVRAELSGVPPSFAHELKDYSSFTSFLKSINEHSSLKDVKLVWKSFFVFSLTTASGPLFQTLVRNLMRPFRYGKRVIGTLRGVRGMYYVEPEISSVGSKLRRALLSKSTQEAIQALEAEEGATASFAKICKLSINQMGKAAKILVAVGVIGSISQAVTAAVEFEKFIDDIDDIMNDRLEYASYIKDLWLPDDIHPQTPSDRGISGRNQGYYDAQGLNFKLDYGRWVNRDNEIYWSVALAGKTNQYTDKGDFSEPSDVSILQAQPDQLPDLPTN